MYFERQNFRYLHGKTFKDKDGKTEYGMECNHSKWDRTGEREALSD
jgi:hypothetical protein